MRTAVLLLALLQFATPPRPSTRVTVAQLEQFLGSKRATKESDSDVADTLMRVEMAEELTPSTLARIGREIRLRPKTVEQIRLLAAESIFEPPPSTEWVEAPAPDNATQERILSAARSYAATTLRHLPDFLATRTTNSYSNAPEPTGPNGADRVVRAHFVSRHRREVTYRNGAEVNEPLQMTGRSASQQDDGFSTSGEFGPTLNMVLAGTQKGTVAWSRWQSDASGARLAVFRYSIPRGASEYMLHLCCFQRNADDHVGAGFNGHPAYHGEIFIHPDSGAVARLTVEAELPSDTPLRRCSIAVEYGPVKIDGSPYICPLRGVAVLVFYSPSMEKIDRVGMEKHINEVRFDEYHKFGSTSRMVNSD